MANEQDLVVAHVASAAGARTGLAAWAVVLTWHGHARVTSGTRDGVKGSQAAIIAVTEAMRALQRPVNVEVRTASTYVFNAFPHLSDWASHRWARREGGRWLGVPNAALWRGLIRAVEEGGHTIRVVHAEAAPTAHDALAVDTATATLERARRAEGGQLELTGLTPPPAP